MKPSNLPLILLFSLGSLTAQKVLATEGVNRAILLNSVIGEETQPVQLLIVEGPAKGCLATGLASLNKKRLRYEFQLEPIHCVQNNQSIPVGQVVRGQHNILGTMANSGMGRSVLISNKGVTVSLTTE